MAGDKDYILPEPQKPIANKQLLVKAVPLALKGQAGLIIANQGLGLIKEKLLLVDSQRMADEQSVFQPGSNYGADGSNSFGPVFDAVVLNGLTYTDFQGNTISLGDFTLEIALIEAENAREIVTTPVTGRDGHVHEYMSDGDWDIKISGVLINPLANIPPETLVRALNQFCKAKKEIKVNSTVLSYLDIYSIIIVRPRFIQRRGERNAIDYELYCLSDTPFELK
jgi:hypothetical protein